MTSAGNIARSGASYEAVLMDKVTEPVDKIINSLRDLEQAFNRTAAPALKVNAAMQGIARSVQATQRPIQQASRGPNMLAQNMTKLRTAALSSGQAAAQALSSIAAAARTAGVTLTGFAVGSALAIKNLIDLSSAAAETQNRFEVAFGSQAAEAERWAISLSRSLGRSTNAIKDFSSTFQTIFTGFGFADQQASLFSQTLTELTFDWASFRDLADEDVMQRFVAGITGSTEATERLGISLKVSALNMELMERGISGTVEEMNEQEKMLVRVLRILSSSEKAIGDVTRTSQSWRNVTKTVTAQFRALRETLGRGFEQALLGPLQKFGAALVMVTQKASEFGPQLARGIVAGVVAMGALGVAFLAVAAGATTLAGVVITLSTAASGLFALASAFGTVVAAVGSLGLALAAIPALMAAIGTAYFAYFTIREFPVTRAISDLANGFMEAMMIMAGSFDAVINAVARGNWKDAWRIVELTAAEAFDAIGADIKLTIYGAILNGFIDGAVAARRWFTRNTTGRLADIGDALGFNTGRPVLPSEITAGQGNEIDERQAELDALIEKFKNADGESNDFQKNLDARMDAIRNKAAEIGETVEKSLRKMRVTREMEAVTEYFQQFEDPLETMNRRFEELDENVAKLSPRMAARMGERIAAAERKILEDYYKTQEEDDLPRVRQFQARSVGAAGAGRFAANLAAFGPTFDPLYREQQKQTQIMTEQLKVQNNTLRTLENADVWSFE